MKQSKSRRAFLDIWEPRVGLDAANLRYRFVRRRIDNAYLAGITSGLLSIGVLTSNAIPVLMALPFWMGMTFLAIRIPTYRKQASRAANVHFGKPERYSAPPPMRTVQGFDEWQTRTKAGSEPGVASPKDA